MKQFRMRSTRFYQISGFLGRVLLNLALLIISLACIAPFVIIVSASFSTEDAIGKYGYTLFPKEFSTISYQYVFADATRVLRAYEISIFVTVVGSLASMLVMSLVAYATSRRGFVLRQPIAFYIFFTMLFSGGLVPSYILITHYLKLQNTIWVLILPQLVNGWNILVLRTFFQDLPEELLDAAKIDGAGEWRIFFQIAIPLSTPGLATIGLFSMLGFWNDWFTALLYIDERSLFPVQYLLYVIMQSMDWLQEHAQVMSESVRPPLLPARMAMAVLGIGPIALGYLFVQRYFIRGIRLGSLKG